MGALGNLYRAAMLSLAFGSVACMPGFLQPSPPKASWAENYDGNVSRNSAESGKFAAPMTDDRSGGSAPAPAKTVDGTSAAGRGNGDAGGGNEGASKAPAAPTVNLRGQKQMPLSDYNRPIMPAPAKKELAAAGSEESEDPPARQSQEAVLPPPGAVNDAGRQQPIAGPALDAGKPQPLPPGPKDPGAMPASRPVPPYIRQTPTASGEILNLQPFERPAERAVEFAFKLSASEAENRLLTARVHKAEADLEARERSLAEVTGEVEQATAEIAKARSEQQALRKEVAAMRQRLRQAEMEDIEMLRAVVAALEKLLETPPRPRE